MKKAFLVEKIALKEGLSRGKVDGVLTSMVEVIIDELKIGGEVSLTGFGTFETMTRHARFGVNPQNPKERIKIPEVRVAKFRTGKRLKDAIK